MIAFEVVGADLVPVFKLLESQLLPQPADVPAAVPGILPKSKRDVPVKPDRLPLGHGWDWPILRTTHRQRYHRKELSLNHCGCGGLSRTGSRQDASFPNDGASGKSLTDLTTPPLGLPGLASAAGVAAWLDEGELLNCQEHRGGIRIENRIQTRGNAAAKFL